MTDIQHRQAGSLLSLGLILYPVLCGCVTALALDGCLPYKLQQKPCSTPMLTFMRHHYLTILTL